MNLLLVSSSFEDAARSKIINSNSSYPLGLGYLHAYIEQYNHTVNTLFLNDYPYEKCKERVMQMITEHAPNVIGFNVITQNRTSTFRLIRIIHKKYPHMRILIGGIHTTVMYRQIVKRFPYIIAVIGEGEITTKELLEKIQTGKSIRHIRGIAYISNGKLIKTPDRELILDLNTLPFPKHEIFFTENRTIACMITSRGCPFHCSFCVLNRITKSFPRKRSVQNVIEEIEHLISLYPQLETVWFHDDQFFLINSRVIEFCKEIVKRKIKLRFICSGRFKPISKEMVTWLEKAGFIQVLLGLESGSPKILDLCHKNITHEDILQAVALFKNTKIQITTFLIVGLYGETQETVNETIQFVQRMQKVNYVFFGDINVAILYPGTELYDIAKRAGIIKDSFWLTAKSTPFFTVNHSVKKLFEFKKQTMDNIGLMRIITPTGFIHQYKMIPWIVKFLIKNIPMYPLYAKHVFQRFFPDAYLKIRSFTKPNYAVHS